MAKAIGSIAKDVEDAGAKLVVFGLDSPFTVEPSVREAEVSRTGGRLASLDLDKPMRWLDRLATDCGLNYLNATELLRAAKRADPAFVAYRQVLEGHLTPEGDEIVGKALGQLVRDRRLIQCSEWRPPRNRPGFKKCGA